MTFSGDQMQDFTKQSVLLKHLQSTSRNLISNTLALSSSNCTITAKMLNSRHGKATNSDLTIGRKPVRRVKTENMDLTKFKNSEDWLLMEMSDASKKMRNNIFAIDGYVSVVINNKKEAVTKIH